MEIEQVLSKMEQDKYPANPVCSKCGLAKQQSDFSMTQMKKHAKRVCLPCVALSVQEVHVCHARSQRFLHLISTTCRLYQMVAFRNSHLQNEIASYTSEDKIELTLQQALERRQAKRERGKQGKLAFQLRCIQDTIVKCRSGLSPCIAQLANSKQEFNESMLDTQQLYADHCSTIIPFSHRTISWDALPASVDPNRSGGLTPDRALRKRQQVQFIFGFLLALSTPHAVIIDVGSASGNFSLPLAALFPACRFVLIDWSESHLQLAKARAISAGLSNVDVHLGGIQSLPADFHFDVCLAMHACGPASDWAQIQALRRNAAYVICPCCLGKGSERSEKEMLRSGRNLERAPDVVVAPSVNSASSADSEPILQRPRSSWLSQKLSHDEFTSMAAQADYNAHSERGLKSSASVADVDVAESIDDTDSAPKRQKHEESFATLAQRAGLPRYWSVCKTLLELDRSAAALQNQYRVSLVKMQPLSASAKNDVLLGLPPQWSVPGVACECVKEQYLLPVDS